MQRVLLVPGWEDVKRGQIFHAIHETEAKDAGGDKAQDPWIARTGTALAAWPPGKLFTGGILGCIGVFSLGTAQVSPIRSDVEN